MELITRTRFYEDVAEEWSISPGRPARKRHCVGAKPWIPQIQKLSRDPKLGRPRTDLQPAGIRSWRVEHFRRWLIFYAVEEKALVLLRVRYGTMNLPALEF